MLTVDVSIIIVHTFEKRLVRQTLRSLRRAAPQISFEVIIVDNRPFTGMHEILKNEFPEVRYTATDKNRGFGHAMNTGIKLATGKYVLIFNPDIVVGVGSLEALLTYMEANPTVGIVGPRLNNPDGTLQFSCYRYHELLIPAYRRTPLGRLPFAKRAIDNFLMTDVDHSLTQEVDWLMGSALFTRRTALDQVGPFDDRFFMYFEDTDLCRRFWQASFKVVYHPVVSMVHYHRRASSDGGLLCQLLAPLTREHIKSALRYFFKYRQQVNPRYGQPGIKTTP